MHAIGRIVLAGSLAGLGPGASGGGEMAIEPEVRRVWADIRTNTLGQPSPDGRYLSFTDWETGDLAVRDLTTGQNFRLTNNPRDFTEYAYFSTFAPDSRRIAYAWFNERKFYELRIINIEHLTRGLPLPALNIGLTTPRDPSLEGTPNPRPPYLGRNISAGATPKPRVLYRSEDVQFIKPSIWSTDGTAILTLFFGARILNQMVLISPEDGSVQVLKIPFWIYPKKMSLSPDRRYVAYDLNQEPPYLQRDISLLSTTENEDLPLVVHPANDVFPVWAPDNRHILFASDRSGTLDLWLIAVADGKAQGPPVPVKKDIGRFLPLGFTSSGAFFYGLRTGNEDAYVASIDPATGEAASSPAPVSRVFKGVNRSPDWSPDGRRLAYLTHVDTENQGLESRVISIRSEETGNEQQVGTPGLSYLNWLRWSPDGCCFLVGGSDTDNFGGLYRVNAETGKTTQIVRGAYAPPRGYEGVWSADGKGIYYVHEDLRDTETSIRYRDLASGEEKQIHCTDTPWRLNNLALSRDGKMLAFGMSKGNRTHASALYVLPASDGKPRELFKLKRAELSGFAWTPDGEHLLFSRKDEPSPRLWRIAVGGGKPRPLGLETNEEARISLHPDGRRIAFTSGKTNIEVWMMDRFLPEFRASR